MSISTETRLFVGEWYARQGFGVFSVWPTDEDGVCRCNKPHPDGKNIGKHPIPPNGFKSATTDLDRIRTMLSAPVGPNVGVTPPEGCFGWDLDGEDADRIKLLQLELGDLPPTFGHRTPNGQHRVYRWPQDVPRPKGNLLGVVTRWSDTGYLIGAGSSIGPLTYGVLVDEADQPLPIVDFPPEWVESTGAAETPSEVGDGGYQLPDRIAAGHRYPETLRYVASRYKRGLSKDEVRAAFLARVAPGFDPPKRAEELREDFERAWSGTERRLGPPIAYHEEVAPEPGPIAYADLAGVLNATVEHLRRFVRFSDPAQAIAVALWVAHTHVYDRADTSPILWIRSAVAESGKTRVFETIEHLVSRPWVCERPSEAVVYRRIDRDRPTLLLDEIDTILKDRSGSFEGLRAIFNAGNRQGTVVSRALDAGKSLTDFEIYCPKAVAGLDRIPDTMKTRAIPIVLQRRAKHESIERLRRRTARELGAPLRDALAHYLREVEVLWLDDDALPEELSDRQMDSWESLLAIADAAGGDWPEQARRAAVVLHAGTQAEEDSWGLRLLADTRVVFSESGVERITSGDLIARIEKFEESPWGDIRGKAITPHHLAKLLRDFNIRPKQYRDDNNDKQRGYAADVFADAWSRYLPAYPEENGPSGTSGTASTHHVPVVPDVPPIPGVTGLTNSVEDVGDRYLRFSGEDGD